MSVFVCGASMSGIQFETKIVNQQFVCEHTRTYSNSLEWSKISLEALFVEHIFLRIVITHNVTNNKFEWIDFSHCVCFIRWMWNSVSMLPRRKQFIVIILLMRFVSFTYINVQDGVTPGSKRLLWKECNLIYRFEIEFSGKEEFAFSVLNEFVKWS